MARRGRPPTLLEPVALSFDVERATKDRLERLAAATARGVAEMTRQAIDEGLPLVEARVYGDEAGSGQT